MKKKIAIVGTSPIMILLFFRLFKDNSIDVFECGRIGGAWRIDMIEGQKYTTHNNFIVALNDEEEHFINMINTELRKLGCSINKLTGIFNSLSKYDHKNLFIHDLSGLYLNFKKNCNSIISNKVESIKILNKKNYINEIEYDHVYLPSCFDICQIIIEDFIFDIDSELSISHHLTVVYSEINYPDLSYTEDFDNVFDRAYFRKNNKNTIFTGRVRRKYKGFDIHELIQFSDVLRETKKNIINLKFNKYRHNIIPTNTLEKLRSKLINTNVNIIETRQFVNSYKHLNKF